MKKCLIVVDYQNDFVTGSFGFPEAAKLDGKIAARIRKCRRNGGEVIFTLDTHFADHPESLPDPDCVKGANGYELYGETGSLREQSDRVFCKFSFGSDELFDYLRSSDFDYIELVGVVTNICVIVNAVLAKTAKPESEIAVNAECVASDNKSLHDAALDVMESLQIKILNREKIF